VEQFDLVVIGGGSAGLKSARTAAKLGAKVALAEERETGGECLWAGCVPTKALVRAAGVWHLVRRAKEFGLSAEVKQADFAGAMAYMRRAMHAVGGDGEPDAGLSRIGVRYYPDRAVFRDAHAVQIGSEVVRADRVILATGTIPAAPPIAELEEAGYITNREAVALESLPRRLVVIGGGPIGLEFAQVFRRFGAEVTVVEVMPRILPGEDADIAELVTGYLAAEGIRILTGAKAVQAGRSNGCKTLVVETEGRRESLSADELLVATGRAAAVGGLGLEAAGVAMQRHYVSTDRFLRTSRPHIWAAGDVSGGHLFTHVASYEGRLAAENAFCDSPVPADLRVVPRATFVDPEVASIGHTEAGAREAGMDVEIRSFSFRDLDRALLHGDPRGMVKLILERPTGQILGAHLVGPDAASLLAEIALAMRHRLPVSAIAETIHAYPTFPEAVEAAALAVPAYDGHTESGAD
jgi:pyruvate/2-oxoglutarate dehydrogenase complex dihydrolipoamide dehydrogenase (E3) component